MESELDRYLGEAVEDDDEEDEKHSDILWWTHAPRFPILSKLAQDV